MIDRSIYPRPYAQAFTYNLTTPATNQPLTLLQVKEHCRLDLLDTSEDDYLNLLIDIATNFGEKYTGRDFINKVYTTFRDNFYNPLLLRRSKVSSITSISYLINNVLTVVDPTIYNFTKVNNFSDIFLLNDNVWPDGIDCVPQAVQIIFTAGYGADNTFVPSDVKFAMLNHIAYMYENRGDNYDGSGGAKLPINSKILYDKLRIVNIGSPEANIYDNYGGRWF